MKRSARRLAWAVAFALLPAAPTAALAKKKPKTASEAKKKGEKIPPPNDKGTNEGAQGRMNATEDAARQAENPQGSGRVP